VLAGHVGSATSVAFSPDGERVVTGGEDGDHSPVALRGGVRHPHHPARTPRRWPPCSSPTTATTCFSASADRALKVWRASDGKLLGKFGALVRSHRRGITSLSLSPDGFRIVTGGADNA
jgi:WD40 repeat protein